MKTKAEVPNPVLNIASTLLTALLLLAWGHAFGNTLSGQDVSRYINATTELHDYEERFDDFEEAWANESDGDDYRPERIRSMISDSLAFMRTRDQEAYQTVDRVSRRHGFSSAEEYGRVGDRVLLAFLAVEMAEASAGFDAEMQETLNDIESSEFFSVEQKESMRAMLEQARAEMEVLYDAPDTDKRAIEPYLPALRELVSFGDDEP